MFQPFQSQKLWLPIIRNGGNLILRDNTGTGKSFGFAMAATEKTNSLLIVPSREQALQMHQWIQPVKNSKCFISATNSFPLIPTPEIIIATPLRFLELMDHGLCMSNIETIFLDEIDRLIDSKKRGQSIGNLILNCLEPFQKQTIVGSATIGDEKMKFLADKIPNATILDFNDKLVPDTIQHEGFYYKNHQLVAIKHTISSQKLALTEDHDLVLKSFVELFPNVRGILVAASSVSLGRLVSRLQKLGCRAEKLMNAQEYDSNDPKMYEHFISGKIDLLCTTEYSVRGLDIPNIDHVFLLGPMSPDSYLHAAGRVGRFGKIGKAITILSGDIFVNTHISNLKSLGIHVDSHAIAIKRTM